MNKMCVLVCLNKHLCEYLAKCEKIFDNVFDLICKFFKFAKAVKGKLAVENPLKIIRV